MFKKLLNVGKGHSASDKLQQQQQQQLQQKNLFQLNEIKSYGFSHLCCLGYSPSLSLLAVGSKFGLLRVLGNASVEFSHQLESENSIRQIEFIDCRQQQQQQQQQQNNRQDQKTTTSKATANAPAAQGRAVSAKIVVLTDNGQLHLFELITVKPQNFADNTTQTDPTSATNDCCQQQRSTESSQILQQQQQQAVEFTKLERVGFVDYFKFKPDDEDKSLRVTTLEVSADGLIVYVGTEGGNLYLVPLSKFEPTSEQGSVQKPVQQNDSAPESGKQTSGDAAAKLVDEAAVEDDSAANKDGEPTCAVNLNDEPQIEEINEPFEIIKFDEDVVVHLCDEVKSKKQGAIESIKRHPQNNGTQRVLISYHRGLNVFYNFNTKQVDKYFYHNQVLESSCFADQQGDFFYTSHNDGSYIKWNTRLGSQTKAHDDYLGQLYGPYPCKPTPKLQACTGLVKDQLEELVIFSGGMPRATYDDKNPVTIVRADRDGKDTIKTVLDFTSKVLDFVVITRPRGNLGAGAKSTGGGKKNKHKKQEKQQSQHQQPSSQIAVALAILAEEEFVVIDLLNSESYLEFALPYLNCVHSSAITCNQHYSDISEELYEQLLAYNKQQLKGKLSANEWPITGGKVIVAPEVKSRDILLTGHEDGSVDFWDVSELSMRHLLHLSTSRFFSTNDDDDLVPIDGQANKEDNVKSAAEQDEATAGAQTTNNEDNSTQQDSAWPPLKRVGRFDPYSDDTRLGIRKLSLCPQRGTLVVAGTGGQILVFELKSEPSELETLVADEVTIVNDQRFTWKGRGKLAVRSGAHKELFEPGYQVSAFVQLDPPVAATSLDLRSDWRLFAVGTNYGFLLYDYANRHTVVTKCTLNVQDYSIVSGDAPGAGTISRKKSFRKSLRESFRRLRRGRSQRQQQVGGETGAKPAFGRVTTGVRTLNAPSSGPASLGGAGDSTGTGVGVGVGVGVHRNVYSTERQVEQKVELSSIVKCLTLTSAVITNNASFTPTLWVGTNSGQVLVYAITLASESQQPSSEQQASPAVQDQATSNQELVATSAKLAKEIQLKHKAPIIAIFTSPDAPQVDQASVGDVDTSQKRVTTDSPTREGSAVGGAGEQQVAASSGGEQARAQSPTADKSPSGKSGKGVDGSSQLQQQPRVLICSEEQFKVFNLPNLKPFCKFKLTAHEGLRAKKISITQFYKPTPTSSATSGGNKQLHQVANQSANSLNKSLQSFATQTSPSASPLPPAEASSEDAATANGAQQSKLTHESNNNLPTALNNNHTATKDVAGGSKELMNAKFGAKSNSSSTPAVAVDKEQSGEVDSSIANASLFEPYMVCMSNQGDCAIYSVPDLKRQAQIQVCKREDVNGITSAMLTNYGEGYYLKSSSNFLRFSISTQRVLRVLSVV